ncbi:MAG: hypothetical protein J6W89_02740 [Paludibacteraceae bacterium]|nr:hypothetical protein [Paludibacteraceae bacterium]
MKKMTLILSALLVSLSILAAPLANANLSAKNQPVKQEAKVAALSVKNLPAFQAAKADANALLAFRKAAQQAQAATTITVQEAGYGVAKATITPGDNTSSLYYQVWLMYNDENMTPVAYVGSFPISTITQYFNSTYSVLYYASNPQYGEILDESCASGILPKGKYLYGLLGYAVNGSSLASEPSDIVVAPFEITLDGSEYAIKNAEVAVGENNKLTVTWEVNTTPIPEGAVYEVTVYSYPSNEKIADSGDIETTSWATPDNVEIADNTSYEINIHVWHPGGYNLGKAATLYKTIGTDPNAPTDLAVTVDETTMKATFTWKNTLDGTYDGNKVYNEVLILDEQGNEYKFDNGYNNTSGETGTSEQLPVGKYTWKVLPFYAKNGWNYLAVAYGPAFEVKDLIAPVISRVFVANTSDTEVNLGIEVTDNAVGVTPADLVYNVSGDITLENASLEADGTLKLTGLTPQKYSIKITATDPSGNVSDPFAFEFIPVEDNEAPKNLTATLQPDNIFDRYVVIDVAAEDNIATAEQLTYVLTFADNTVVELQANTGQLKLENLAPETDYKVTVTVKDFGGNVSEESVKLEFTTLALIPIELDVEFAQLEYYEEYSEEGAQNFTLVVANLDEAGTNLDIPYAFFDIYTKTTTAFQGVYSQANGNLNNKYCGFYYNEYKQRTLSNAEVTLKYLRSEVEDGVTYYQYYILAKFIGDDGNLYKMEGGFWINIWITDTQKGTTTDTFVDDDAPELWVSEDYPVEVKGTTAEIMFGVYDGPFYLKTGETYTEVDKLILQIQTEDGQVLASAADGTIENTPTLDDDGAYYFTATLTNLEEDKDYTVYIYAKDEAGNVADRLKVEFKTGNASAVEDIVVRTNVQKLFRDGQLIIKRDAKMFNVLGTELR